MITFPAMLRNRLWGLDPFLLGVALLCLLATAFAISPSSYGIVRRGLGAADDGVLLARPRPIRSDEYALWTPMVQQTVLSGYAQADPNSIYGDSQRHLYPLPLRDWGLAFKPTFWLFLLLPPAWAYAGYFAACTFLFVAGFYLLSRRFGCSPLHAALISLLLYYSAYTQTWWTSLGHHLAIFPWIPLLYLAEMRPHWRAAALALATGCWFLGGTFYPPLVWTLLLCGLLGIWVFRPETLRLSRELLPRQLASVAGMAAGAAAAYLYLKEPLAIMLGSSGHGARNLSGGYVPWQDFLGIFFPLFSYQGGIVISGKNHCEASTAGSALWPLLLCFLDYRASWRSLLEHPDRRALLWRMGALAAAFLLLAAWMLLPLPPWVGLPFLWTKFPNSRLLFAAGLLTLWLALLLFRFARFRFGPGRLALFCAATALAWWPSRIDTSLEFLRAREFRALFNLEWYDRANSDLLPAVLVCALAGAAWLLRGRQGRFLPATRWAGPTGALAVAALANAFFFFDWNPWMSSRKIFEKIDTPHVARLRELQEAHPQRWLVVGGWEHLGRTLSGLGFRSVNYGFIVPETRLLRQRFPALDQGTFDYLFNRYCLVQLMLLDPFAPTERLRQPNFPGGDLVPMPIDAFLPETKVELKQGAPAAALPAGGELRQASLAGNRLKLSFSSEISGTSGQSEVKIFLDRPGKIVDRWLRPRGDDFDLSAGLKLYSRLDLEIELENPPASLADLALCIETRDPGFGAFALAPNAAVRSSCPPQESAVTQQPAVDLVVDRP
jgi:hypothetical protein